ncbi:FKBP-type peptidyl-prolyl cis-trans isomerase [Membranihabitans maritimus]|uniref:FKBP-type peptidyl-prolyl cis-trans isomerase n=1 Tax=Membranihabitans maritimus TaxID=2904244 RepID=UPI001F01AF29|nr:FKBP-type peptidyl-prolyl cis-trans isomerase [Membranihabitans maritimus]
MRITSLFILMILSMWSCTNSNSDQPAVEGTTEDGYKYNIYSSNLSGKIIEPGKYIYFTAAVLLDDTMSLQPKSEVIRMEVPTDSSLAQQPNPVMDVLRQMSPGDSANVYIELDSIPQAKMQFPNNKFINNYFVVEDVVEEDQYLDDVAKEKEEAMEEMKAAQVREEEIAGIVEENLEKYKSGDLANELNQLESGLEILTLEDGLGEEVGNGPATVHYYGVLEEDGTMFDNSFKRGTPFSFKVGAGSVIPGWDEGIAKLKPGEKAVLFIPSDLGYGENGSGQTIPPNSDLVFYVELVQK